MRYWRINEEISLVVETEKNKKGVFGISRKSKVRPRVYGE